MKMSNMLQIAVDLEQVEIGQASERHWEKVQRTRSQLFFAPMFSPEGHQTFETLKSKQRGLFNFYLHQFEGNREINLCRSFLILKFLIFTVPDNTQQHCGCLGSDVWLKKSSLLVIFSSLIFQAVQNVFLSIPCWYTPYKA